MFEKKCRKEIERIEEDSEKYTQKFKEEAIEELNRILNAEEGFVVYTKEPYYSRPETHLTNSVIWDFRIGPGPTGKATRTQRTRLYQPVKIANDGYCGSFTGAGGCLVDVYKKDGEYQLSVHQTVQWNNQQNYTNTTADPRKRWDVETGKEEEWLEEFQQEARADKQRKKNFFEQMKDLAKEENLPFKKIIGKSDIVSMVKWVAEVKQRDPDIKDIKQVRDKAYAWAYAEDVLGSWVKDLTPSFPLLQQTLEAYLEFVVDSQ